MKGYLWNHRRLYRIYRELDLNLRIKPRKPRLRVSRQARFGLVLLSFGMARI